MCKGGINMEENYTYPVIFETINNEYTDIIFPDFENTMTSAYEDQDVIQIAQDFLALTLQDYFDEQKATPDPSSFKDIQLEKNQQCVYVNVWMPYHRSQIKETYIKKTLTIPAWLDIIAKNHNINFSQTLVKALKEELKIR